MTTHQPSLFDDTPVPGEYAFTANAQRARCASCGAAIVWIRTAADKAMPLSLKTRREIGGVTYALSHFIDCPQGKQWSRR